jgi:hypothetical protein
MQRFSAYLQSVSPETLVLLKQGNVSFRYRGQYEFRVTGVRDIFDQLSNSPHIDRIKDAASNNPLGVRISFVDSKTGTEFVTLIAHTRKALKFFAVRNVSCRSLGRTLIEVFNREDLPACERIASISQKT